MKPVALPTGVLEEFQCGRDNYFQKAEKKSPRFTSVFSTSFLYLFHIYIPSRKFKGNKGILQSFRPRILRNSNRIPIGKADGLSAFICCIIAPNLVWS